MAACQIHSCGDRKLQPPHSRTEGTIYLLYELLLTFGCWPLNAAQLVSRPKDNGRSRKWRRVFPAYKAPRSSRLSPFMAKRYQTSYPCERAQGKTGLVGEVPFQCSSGGRSRSRAATVPSHFEHSLNISSPFAR